MLNDRSSPTARPQDSFIETVKTVAWAVVIAVMIRSFLFEPFTIPSNSMVPTLLTGDFVFVSKYSYGYSRYSFPFGIVPIDDRIWKGEPRRGDVAVFRLPTNTSENYIKRLVGLPGDRIQVTKGILHINGKPVTRERSDACRARAGRIEAAMTGYVETLPDGRKHCIFERSDEDWLDNTPEFTVPSGHYFAMGDNRDNSVDSRARNRDGSQPVGFVPAANLVGRAEIVWLSVDEDLRWYEFWRWPFSLRFGRMFTGIE
ncbi:MAG: signal peptidase I [Alphaproteobacteria bacterium]|nr:signal peptidase I [Alphaproteobacteria bacterium]